MSTWKSSIAQLQHGMYLVYTPGYGIPPQLVPLKNPVSALHKCAAVECGLPVKHVVVDQLRVTCPIVLVEHIFKVGPRQECTRVVPRPTPRIKCTTYESTMISNTMYAVRATNVHTLELGDVERLARVRIEMVLAICRDDGQPLTRVGAVETLWIRILDNWYIRKPMKKTRRGNAQGHKYPRLQSH